MEPQSHFAIGIENNQDEILCSPEGIVYPTRFIKDWLVEGKPTNFIIVQRANPTSPSFPFVIKLNSKIDSDVRIVGLFRAISSTKIKPIPIIQE